MPSEFRLPRYFNYKKYNSIVLLTLVDSNCFFTVIDVGSYGRENDSTIFQSSILGQKLNKEALDLPEEEELVFGGPKMPYVIVADEAFGIHRNLMRPYPGRCLPTDKKIFNYRPVSCETLRRMCLWANHLKISHIS